MSRSVFAATALLAGVAMVGCSAPAAPVASPTTKAPSTFQVTGSIDVSADLPSLWGAAGGPGNPTVGVPCHGDSGYDDITSGAQVTIRDGAGKVIAVGQLESGFGSAEGLKCTFPLSASDVPSGLPFYSVEVSHRGQIQYTEAKIREPLSLKLS